MIPISLSLEGLYSYQQKQQIDFEQLSAAQIFGIFGATGSGKSSILEAISFALYGESERLNKQDRRGYNMMNLKSDRLFISFEFHSHKKRYRFEVKNRRNSKNFEKVDTITRTAYEETNGEWLPIEVSSAEEIIGLSYQNFKRTIIIPQGRFQEFLQLGDTDRTRMLKEIFQLEKYELYHKAVSLERKNQAKIAELETLLGQLIHATPEAIQEVKIQRTASEKQISETQKVLDERKKAFAKYEELQQQRQRLEAQENVVKNLQEKLPIFQDREERLGRYELCLVNFKPLLNKEQEFTHQLEQTERVLIDKESVFAQTSTEREKAEAAFVEIKKNFEQRDNFLQYATELQSIIELKAKDENNTNTARRIENGKKVVIETEQKIKDHRAKRKEIDQKIVEIKKDSPDISQLLAVRDWFQQLRQLEIQAEQNQQLLSDVEKRRDRTQEAINTSISPTSLTLEQQKLPLEQLITLLSKQKKSSQGQVQETQKTIAQLSAQQQLHHFAEALEDGKPCPLCGSIHHPEKGEFAHIGQKLSQAQEQLEVQKKEEETCEKALISLESLQKQQKEVLAEYAEWEQFFFQSQQAIDQHKAAFTWKNWEGKSLVEVEKELQRLKAVQENIQDWEVKLAANNEGLDKEEQNLAKYTQVLETLQSQYNTLKIDFDAGIKVLKLSDYQHYSHISNQEIEVSIAENKQQYEQVESLFREAEKRLQSLRSNLDKLRGEIDTLKSQKQQQTQASAKHAKLIQEQISSSKFSGLAEIKEILSWALNPSAERDAISRFKQELHTASGTLAELRAQLKDKDFAPAAFQALKEEIDQLDQSLSEQTLALGGLQKELARLQSDLEQKKKHEQALASLKLRGEDIKTLKSMFFKSGFVNYVSTIFLQNLCNAANHRFMKLSKGALRLETTINNQFQVRDFLNNGQTRSVKTLSGGQTFQAALSLALALADQVQQQAQADQNFFFLDEGFGSQDKNSLQLIFQSLKSLRKENRIVGVISHVEDLQQEIDTFLHIHNDPETGSKVRTSWN